MATENLGLITISGVEEKVGAHFPNAYNGNLAALDAFISHHDVAGVNLAGSTLTVTATDGTEYSVDISSVVPAGVFTGLSISGGVITLTRGDGTTVTVENTTTAAKVAYDNSDSDLEAETVQDAVDELESSKQDTLIFDTAPTDGSSNPATSGGIHAALALKADRASTYTKAEVDEALADVQGALVFDDAPTAGSSNPVKSGGIFTAIQAAGKAPDWNVNDSSSPAYIRNRPFYVVATTRGRAFGPTINSGDYTSTTEEKFGYRYTAEWFYAVNDGTTLIFGINSERYPAIARFDPVKNHYRFETEYFIITLSANFRYWRFYFPTNETRKMGVFSADVEYHKIDRAFVDYSPCAPEIADTKYVPNGTPDYSQSYLLLHNGSQYYRTLVSSLLDVIGLTDVLDGFPDLITAVRNQNQKLVALGQRLTAVENDNSELAQTIAEQRRQITNLLNRVAVLESYHTGSDLTAVVDEDTLTLTGAAARVENGVLAINSAAVSVQNGALVVNSGHASVSDSVLAVSGTVEDGVLTVGGGSVSDGQLTI